MYPLIIKIMMHSIPTKDNQTIFTGRKVSMYVVQLSVSTPESMSSLGLPAQEV